MTSHKIDKLNAENLEPRVAPVVADQPGGSDGHRNKDWKRGLVQDPGTQPGDPVPTPGDGPYEEPIL